MRWRSYFRSLMGCALTLGAVCFGFILIIDPYQNVPFSPAFARAPIDTNQRFSYPALARRAEFDSAIFGSSTTRLLNPDNFDRLLQAHFANFSMNGATAWEQTQIFHLFNRHHPEARYLIFGIDVVWCEVGAEYERYTFRLFPTWMYDENTWNDLAYLFNDKALENAVREFEFLLGKREAKYQLNGFRSFVPGDEVWDLERVQRKIYGAGDIAKIKARPIPDVAPSVRHPRLNFPTHALMREILDAAPRAAEKVLVFVPYHQHYLRIHGMRTGECKGRLIDIASGYDNTHVLDFMIESRITRNEEHYWDVLHYNIETAERLDRLIVQGIKERRDSLEHFHYQTASRIQR